MDKSIYELISENTTNGVLNKGFFLPEENKDDSVLPYAPGAFDGICLFHMANKKVDRAQMGQMAEALERASGGYFPQADALFAEWTKEHRAIRIVDHLQDYVLDHTDHLDAQNILNAAMYLIIRSSHIECVKIGLELLELFRVSHKDSAGVKEIVRCIGQYDEFTIFAIWNMRKWDDGNQEIFELAKKVHGWGRIHAVVHLKPETEEIRHWFLTEGTINDIGNTYSAVNCWWKSDAETILFGQPTAEEYNGIATLIEGLLDEGPVRGISALENAEKILLRFMEISQDYEPTDDILNLIQRIRKWLENQDKTDS